jgi:hypothetical protein
MLDTRSVLRSGLIVCIAGIVGLAVSAAVAAGEGGFPLAFATAGNVQSGSHVQSASGVLKTLHRLALDADYTEAEAEALVAAAARLIETGGIPPGIILVVSRQLVSGMTAEQLIETLEEIARRIAGGEPPGQVVNEILTRGNGKNSAASASGNGTNTGENVRESGNGSAESGSDAEDDDDGSGNGYTGNGNSAGGHSD